MYCRFFCQKESLLTYLLVFYELPAYTNKDIFVKVGYQKRCCCLSKQEINQ